MSKSVALVHDYLLVRRGAERSFEAIADCWPEAPIYTLLYDPAVFGDRFAGREIHTSRLQRLPVSQGNFRSLLPLFTRAVRSLPLGGYDVVISSSSAFAHGVRTRPDATHVCYCYSPFRYAWFEEEQALQEVAPPLRPLLRRTLARVRDVDRAVSQQVTRYVAISAISQERIRRYWGRSSSIVHPPVEVERFDRPRSPAFDLLMVTELVRHKRVDVALEAARRAGATVRVVGEGSDKERLESEFGGRDGTAEFLGRVGDVELSELFSGARAFVMANVEEFGIAAVEAQAAGVPVVAPAAGGALETVIEGETGVLVRPGDTQDLADAISRTDFDSFDSARIVRQAARFSKSAFQKRFRDEVARASEFTAGAAPSKA
jgi:glycosyltransferase involved in cell wall biosynthesis